MIPIPAAWKTYLDIAGFVAFIVLVTIIVHHLEAVGAARIQAQDAAVLAADHAKMIEQEQQWQAKAEAAQEQRDATQKQLEAYMASNPIGHVFLCNPGRPKPAVPSTAATNPGDASPSSGPAAVPDVPEGTDIGAGLATIVRAAATLDGLYRQYQQQPQAAAVSQ
jgi:hypothetical protein